MTVARTAPHRRLLHLVVAALVALGCAAGVLVAGNATPAAASGDDEVALFAATNQSRAANGRPALSYDAAASNVARAWAQELARSQNLRHNPNVAGQVDAQVTRQWTRLGENVGYAPSVASLQSAYMNSSGHRANILGDFNRVGVGTARDAAGRLWSTVVFTKGPAIPSASPAVSAASFAPYAGAPQLVAAQYQGVLRRSPDAGGLSHWSATLGSGQTNPTTFVAGLLGSPEAQGTVAPIVRLYDSYFQRFPDAAGLTNWVGAVRAGMSLRQVAEAFAGSPEFRQTYGSLDHVGFVQLVYRNVLDRGPDGTGLQHWLGHLRSSTLDRGGVMLGFSESAENLASSRARTTVAMAYLSMLGRAPDPTGLQHWGNYLQAGRSVADLVSVLWSSAEFRGRTV